MKKLVVLGGGISGYGSAILARRKGFDVFLSDSGRIVAAVERHGIDLIVVGQHVPPFEIGLRRSQVAGEGLVVLRITEPHVDARNAHGDTSFERSRRLSPCGETAEQQQGYNPDFFHVIHRFLV